MSAATDVIARMVVGVDADVRGLKRGFDDATRFTQGFVAEAQRNARTLEREMERAGIAGTEAGRQVERGLRQSMRAVELAASQMRMRIASQLRLDQALANQISRLDPFVAGMGRVGFEAGQTLGRSMAQGFGQANVINNIRRALGVGGAAGAAGAGLLGSSRTQTAAIAGLFTIANLGDAFAAGETKLTRFSQGLSSVMKASAGVAAFFGPKGLIAAGVLATTSFIIDFFAKTRDEATRTAKLFKEQIDQMIDAGDPTDMMARIQRLELGRPSAGASPIARGAFRGGILDFEAQIRAQEQAAKSANIATAGVYKRSIADLRRQLQPLIEERARLTDAILNPLAAREIRGALSINVGAPAPGTEFARLQRETEKVLRLYRLIGEQGTPAVAESRRLVDLYFQLGRAIDSIKNPWDDQAVALKSVRAEIEKLIPLLRGAGFIGPTPRVGITPSKPPPIPGPPSPTLGPVGQLPMLERILGVALGNMVRDIGKNVGDVLKATLGAALGPVSLLFRAMEPALRVLSPLLDAFVAPLAAVVQVIVSALEPALRLLFPVIKLVAIVLSFLGEIVSRVTAVVARAFGNLIIGIGKAIRALSLGTVGKGIIKAGESILRFADSTKKSADEMGRVRKQLYGMDFGDTADAITGLGDAAHQATAELLNVPYGYRVALARFLATAPDGPRRGAPSGNPDGRGGTGGPGGGPALIVVESGASLVVHSQARSTDELFRDIAGAAQERSLRRFGTTARAADTLAYRGS